MMLLALPACASKRIVTGGTEMAACRIFNPIRDSSRDTKETQDQVQDHNDVWDGVCLPKDKK